MNVKLPQARLSQYGLIWIGAFLGVLLVSLGAILGLMRDFVPIADLLLEIALGALGLLIAVFMFVTQIARQGIATKLILLLLGLLLILPLLWSPVLAIVIAAHVDPCGGGIFERLCPVPHRVQPHPLPAGAGGFPAAQP